MAYRPLQSPQTRQLRARMHLAPAASAPNAASFSALSSMDWIVRAMRFRQRFIAFGVRLRVAMIAAVTKNSNVRSLNSVCVPNAHTPFSRPPGHGTAGNVAPTRHNVWVIAVCYALSQASETLGQRYRYQSHGAA